MISGLARRLRGETAADAGLSLMRPRIVVFGVGGAGGNAVNNMITSELKGAAFVAANTDAQALSHSLAERRVQLGRKITEGLGAGARPEIGRHAAEEAAEELAAHLGDAHIAFITAGMGGGTGTGAAPVIARIAREHGILTVGVVTKPFHFEGPKRTKTAEAGIKALQQFVDTLLIIPNENLFRVASEKTSLVDAFKMADDVLRHGVSGITDLMVKPGLVNLDFADIRTVMGEMGRAMMGSGEAEGEERAVTAAEAALANPLLANVSLKGALGVLVNVTGGRDITLHEIDLAVSSIRDEVDPDANLIFGSAFDEGLKGHLRVTVFATGIGPGRRGRGRTAPAAKSGRRSRAAAKPRKPSKAGAGGAAAKGGKPRVKAGARRGDKKTPRKTAAAAKGGGKVKAAGGAGKRDGKRLTKEDLRRLSVEIGEFFLIEEVIEGKTSFNEHNKTYGASSKFVKDVKKLRDLGLVTCVGDDIGSCRVTDLARRIYKAKREGAKSRGR